MNSVNEENDCHVKLDIPKYPGFQKPDPYNIPEQLYRNKPVISNLADISLCITSSLKSASCLVPSALHKSLC